MQLSIRPITLALGLLLLAGLAQGQVWNLQIVDDAGDAGNDSQIVATSDGTPYIFYKTSSDLIVAWWVPGGGDTGGWQFRVLDTAAVGGYAFEVLVDSQDHFHLAWSRYTNPGVRYGVYDPATQTWLLGPEGVTGASTYSYVDLALVSIGPDLVPVVAANQSGNKSYVYKRDPGTGTWSNTMVDPLHNTNRGTSVAVDSAHNLHVSYYEASGQNLMYATKAWDDAVWQVSTVDLTGNVGDYSSIVVDSTDRVHIVYYDTTNGDLKYATLLP